MIEKLSTLETGIWYSLQDRPDRMHIEITLLYLRQHKGVYFEYSECMSRFKRINK